MGLSYDNVLSMTLGELSDLSTCYSEMQGNSEDIVADDDDITTDTIGCGSISEMIRRLEDGKHD